MDKNTLRKIFLLKRSSLSLAEVKRLSRLACQKFLKHNLWQTATSVLLYMPVRNEIEPDLLLNQAELQVKQIYLPRVVIDKFDNKIKNLDFCLYKGKKFLQKGSYDILEPDPKFCPSLIVSDISSQDKVLCVVPGLVFDYSGFRIGYGAGCYDKFLSQVGANNLCTCGFAYNFQLIEKLPAQAFDRSLNFICTEQELFEVEGNAYV